jgi:predicted nucleic acid-binding protein
LNYVADTNVVSEFAKPRRDESVIEWFAANRNRIYVSAITIGELRRGIERLPAGKKQIELSIWLQDFCSDLGGRLLAFNASTAHVWGQLKAKWEAAGVSIPALDGQIAATAHRYGCTIATRNVADFRGTGLKVFNPFEPGRDEG